MARVSWSAGALCVLSFCLVGLPGGNAPRASEAVRYDAETRAYNLAHGRVVFTGNCLECHESGRRGAPVVGDVDDWRDRLEQPLSTLIQHAIHGHGDMPPRGDLAIGDQDVAAAVAYVVDRARLIAAAADINDLPPPAAGPNAVAEVETPSDRAIVQMFLMLLGKERWK